MTSFFQKHTFIAYYIIAVLTTTLLVLPIIVASYNFGPLSVSPDWHPVGALGPILAACLVTYIVLGQLGLLAFIKSWFDTQFTLRLFLFSISPILLYPVVAIVVYQFREQTTSGFTQLSLAWWINVLVASVAYGIGEEVGWRGFALPRLQERLNALGATVILTIFHALWHFPFFFYRLQFDFGVTIGFFVGMLAGAIFMTYLYNESGGKTLLPILFHTTWNIVSQIALATQPQVTYTLSTLLMLAALFVVIKFSPTNLATRPKHAINKQLHSAVSAI